MSNTKAIDISGTSNKIYTKTDNNNKHLIIQTGINTSHIELSSNLVFNSSVLSINF